MVISWQTTPKNVQGSQKTMLYIMPLFIGYISITFPSGLVIYWVVCNVFQFVQQTIMFRSEMTARLADARKGVVTVRTPKKDEAPKKRRAVKKQAEKRKKRRRRNARRDRRKNRQIKTADRRRKTKRKKRRTKRPKKRRKRQKRKFREKRKKNENCTCHR